MTIFVIIIGPFMLNIFGPAGPFMHLDHIFLYRTWDWLSVRDQLGQKLLSVEHCKNVL